MGAVTNSDEVDGLKVDDLKKELKKRDLACSGRKADLQERLREAIQNPGTPATPGSKGTSGAQEQSSREQRRRKRQSTLGPESPSKEGKQSPATTGKSSSVTRQTEGQQQKSPQKGNNAKQKRQEPYEFGGPIIAILLVVALPVVCVMLHAACNEEMCITFSRLSVPRIPKEQAVFNWESLLAFSGWVLACFALHAALPGKRVSGTPLSTGNRLSYKLNGLWVAMCMMGMVATGYQWGYVSTGWVRRNFVALQVAGFLVSFLVSVALYVKARSRKAVASHTGNTGKVAYDFWMGRELNPRIWNVDLKEFLELTPGLTAWAVLNALLLLAALEEGQRFPLAILLICILQGHYVVDALAHEPSILSTMDITTDGLGFMLVFGDLVWVPFTYTLQARFLLNTAHEPSYAALAAGFLLHAIGYAIFRRSNRQKDLVRRAPNHPSVKGLPVIKTKRGTALLKGGYWGMCRHPNYLGDWLMGLGWCVVCGFASPVPYFYAVYFALLLAHREWRDDKLCRRKYGADWDRYCQAVPSRIVPYVH